MDRRGAAFCYPVEISHGFLENLLELRIDWLFLPHFKGAAPRNGNGQVPAKSITCPLSQGEPYYLGTAFKDHPAYLALKKPGASCPPSSISRKGMRPPRVHFSR